MIDRSVEASWYVPGSEKLGQIIKQESKDMIKLEEFAESL